MCGIAGIWNEGGVVDLALVRAMTAALRHRGPDGRGDWGNATGTVGFGHARLAIIDLSAAGAQPMVADDAGLAITFNGEIYNYQELRERLATNWCFRSETDTEVILAGFHRWGTGVVERLVGMFAFAIWDERSARLFLARDRAGEKPLYYHASSKCFAFASELKALFECPFVDRLLDWPAALTFFQHGYLTGVQTMVQSVRRLLPGRCLEVTRQGMREWRYWVPPELRETTDTDEQLTVELESLLADAVARQMVADVPVGILLSGGVDSSLITALAARQHRARVRTFTITFPENPQLDEARHAQLIAKSFGTSHTELEAQTMGPQLLPQLARQFDEPLGDSSLIPTHLVSMLARQHCTVVLGGDGGDELFGGYHHYSRLLRLEQLAQRVPAFAANGLERVARHALPFGLRGRNYLMSFRQDASSRPQLPARLFDSYTLSRLLGRERVAIALTDETDYGAVFTKAGLLDHEQRRDFENYLPGDILTKVDRASMLTSLEVRAPMLDHRVIEFAFGRVPERLKATMTERKILLKLLARRLLPPAFDLKRKQGFSIPMRQWLQGDWGRVLFDVLAGAPAELFDRRFVASLVAGQRTGHSNGEVIFALGMFELWRREYCVRF